MDSAGPVEDHTRQASEPPKKAHTNQSAAQRNGSDGPRRPKMRQAEPHAPSTAQFFIPELREADSASQPPEGLQPGSLQQTLKTVLKAYAVPGSRLSVKSSHAAVEAAADEILALYANPKSNLLGCRAAELEATFAGEHARQETVRMCKTTLLF